MMTRRSTGKTRIARALWYARKGAVELRAAPLAPVRPGEARVRTLFSGISRGTERLVVRRSARLRREGRGAREQLFELRRELGIVRALAARAHGEQRKADGERCEARQ